MPFVTRVRRAAAVLALAGLLTPVAAAAVATLHVSGHHAAGHEERHDQAVDLSLAWHGHAHEDTTPDHDHPLLVAGTPGFRIPTVDQPLRNPPGLWRHAPHAAAAERRVRCSCPPGLAGVGPPGPLERQSILRI